MSIKESIMTRKEKLKTVIGIRKLIRKTKHRDFFSDTLMCEEKNIPDVLPEKGYITIKIDGQEYTMTYSQLSYIYIATLIIYGKI